ncbi:MAG: hypothetical protein D3916_04040 [Candidatus Electrothrix sp. MAN1_4]|nr:hypothetical protein [Candidatus Electrothrix sp. MAN1_4]
MYTLKIKYSRNGNNISKKNQAQKISKGGDSRQRKPLLLLKYGIMLECKIPRSLAMVVEEKKYPLCKDRAKIGQR